MKRAQAHLLVAVCMVALMQCLVQAQGLPAQETIEAMPQSTQYTKNSHHHTQDRCTGRIDTVWCREDVAGRLSQIAYNNTATGLQLGCGSKDWTDAASKTLRLSSQESIINVETCKAGVRSGLIVTITTDLGQVFTCGGAAPHGGGDYASYSPAAAMAADADADEDGGDDEDESATDVMVARLRGQTHGSRRRPHRRSRQLLVGAEPAHHRRCVNFVAATQPAWSDVPKWWDLDGTNGPVGRVGSGADAYFKYKANRYFKDPATYSLQQQAYTTNPSSFSYHPFFYYRSVFPLAAFDAECSTKGLIKQLSSFCYNANYKPVPEPVNGVPAVLLTTLAEQPDGTPFPCPSTPAEIQKFNQDLSTVSQGVSQASGGIVQSINWQPYTADNCVAGGSGARVLLAVANSTVVVTGAFVLGAGHTQAELYAWVATGTTDNDLCTASVNSQSVCAGTSFYTIEVVLQTAGPQAARHLLHMHPALPAATVGWGAVSVPAAAHAMPGQAVAGRMHV